MTAERRPARGGAPDGDEHVRASITGRLPGKEPPVPDRSWRLYGWGLPAEGLWDELRTLHLLPKTAWLTAQATGDADAAFAELQEQIARVAYITEMHLRGAIERGHRRDNSIERSARSAERRIMKALSTIAIASLASDSFDPHGFYVYCLWGEYSEHRPLYVGQSTNILARLGSHLGDRKKRKSIKRVTVMRCKNKRHMDETEMRLIREHRPPWNSAGVDRDPRNISKLTDEEFIDRVDNQP